MGSALERSARNESAGDAGILEPCLEKRRQRDGSGKIQQRRIEAEEEGRERHG